MTLFCSKFNCISTHIKYTLTIPPWFIEMHNAPLCPVTNYAFNYWWCCIMCKPILNCSLWSVARMSRPTLS